MHIDRFKVPVYIGGKVYEDDGFILLPEGYGENTRLVINCHGAGGTVTTDDSQVERQALTRYLVMNGYAVMDVCGLPAEYAAEKGVDICNNIGSPIAIDSYVWAYTHCVEKFGLRPEVLVHGGSMGGISSTNLVLSGRVPVLAHSAFCPVLDTYNEIFLHPWSNGLPKVALGKIYSLATDEAGEYIYDEQKVMGFNPAQNPKAKHYPVPLKVWQCKDDAVVSFAITEKYIETIRQNGGRADLVAFETGGHEPQLVGPAVTKPFGKADMEIMPAVDGVLEFFETWK
jgi:hypothetical protein